MVLVHGSQQERMDGNLGGCKHLKIVVVELRKYLVKHLWGHVWAPLGHFLA
jgi:hypothetical protein